MLTHQQILHFSTFGYLTLRGLFSQSETAALRDEVTSALVDAFGQLGTEPDHTGGISGDYLPLAADRAPFSQSLIADDERTFLASAELLGGPIWREWAAGAGMSPSRALAVERLKLLGVITDG